MQVAEAVKKFPVGDLSHLLEQVEIPVLTGPQAQGDVFWFPIKEANTSSMKPIPAEGLVIVEGLNGHPHTLFSEGECLWMKGSGQQLGKAFVPKGSTLIVGHNEHGYSALGAGTYQFNRSREMSSEIRLLAD